MFYNTKKPAKSAVRRRRILQLLSSAASAKEECIFNFDFCVLKLTDGQFE